MILVLFASLLVGAVLSVSEYLFILFSCGPFWMTPWILVETWGVYTAAAFFPLLILNALLTNLPGLKSRFSPPRLRFLLLLSAGWIVAGALLVTLVAKDLRNDDAVRNLVVIISVFGLSTSGFGLFFIKDVRRIVGRGLTFGLVLFVLAVIAYFTQSYRYSNLIKERNIGFNAKIPHLCLLVLDTTRGDRLSCYGYDKPTTPNIDRIAAEGLLCTNAYSAANWTPPGHISIFTGKYPLQHGNDGKPFMPNDLLSITEILNQRGFFCVALYNNPIAGKSINLTPGI